MAVTPPCSTMLLDTEVWDLVLDASGNWAAAAPPYAVAQDAASECRTFLGEVFYDTLRGIPYLPGILGTTPPVALLKAQLTSAALLVPGATAAQTFITSIVGRTAKGQVQVTQINGIPVTPPVVAGF